MEASSDGHYKGENSARFCSSGMESRGRKAYRIPKGTGCDTSPVGYAVPVDCTDRNYAFHAHQVNNTNNVTQEAARVEIGLTNTNAVRPPWTGPRNKNHDGYFHVEYADIAGGAIPGDELCLNCNHARNGFSINTVPGLSNSLPGFQTNNDITGGTYLNDMLKKADDEKAMIDFEPSVLGHLISEVKYLCSHAANRGTTSSPNQKFAQTDNKHQFCGSNTSRESPAQYYTETWEPSTTSSDGVLQEFSFKIKARCLPNASLQKREADDVQDFEVQVNCIHDVMEESKARKIPSGERDFGAVHVTPALDTENQGQQRYNAGSSFSQEGKENYVECFRSGFADQRYGSRDCNDRKTPWQQPFQSPLPDRNLETRPSPCNHFEDTFEVPLETPADNGPTTSYPNSNVENCGFENTIMREPLINLQDQAKFSSSRSNKYFNNNTSNPYYENESEQCNPQMKVNTYLIPRIKVGDETSSHNPSREHSLNLQDQRMVPGSKSGTATPKLAMAGYYNSPSKMNPQTPQSPRGQPAILECRFSQDHCCLKCEIKTPPLKEIFSRIEFPLHQYVRDQGSSTRSENAIVGNDRGNSLNAISNSRESRSQNASMWKEEENNVMGEAGSQAKNVNADSAGYNDEYSVLNYDNILISNTPAASCMSGIRVPEQQDLVLPREPAHATREVSFPTQQIESKKSSTADKSNLRTIKEKDPKLESNATSTEGLTMKIDSSTFPIKGSPCFYGFESLKHFCQNRSTPRIGSEAHISHEVVNKLTVSDSFSREDAPRKVDGSTLRMVLRKYAIERVVPDDDQVPWHCTSNDPSEKGNVNKAKSSKSHSGGPNKEPAPRHGYKKTRLEKSSYLSNVKHTGEKVYIPSSIDESATPSHKSDVSLRRCVSASTPPLKQTEVINVRQTSILTRIHGKSISGSSNSNKQGVCDKKGGRTWARSRGMTDDVSFTKYETKSHSDTSKDCNDQSNIASNTLSTSTGDLKLSGNMEPLNNPNKPTRTAKIPTADRYTRGKARRGDPGYSPDGRNQDLLTGFPLTLEERDQLPQEKTKSLDQEKAKNSGVEDTSQNHLQPDSCMTDVPLIRTKRVRSFKKDDAKLNRQNAIRNSRSVDTQQILPNSFEDSCTVDKSRAPSNRDQSTSVVDTPLTPSDQVKNSFVVDTLICPNRAQNSVDADSPQTLSNRDLTSGRFDSRDTHLSGVHNRNRAAMDTELTAQKMAQNKGIPDAPQTRPNRVQKSGIVDASRTLPNEAQNFYELAVSQNHSNQPQNSIGIDTPQTHATQYPRAFITDAPHTRLNCIHNAIPDAQMTEPNGAQNADRIQNTSIATAQQTYSNQLQNSCFEAAPLSHSHRDQNNGVGNTTQSTRNEVETLPTRDTTFSQDDTRVTLLSDLNRNANVVDTQLSAQNEALDAPQMHLNRVQTSSKADAPLPLQNRARSSYAKNAPARQNWAYNSPVAVSPQAPATQVLTYGVVSATHPRVNSVHNQNFGMVDAQMTRPITDESETHPNQTQSSGFEDTPLSQPHRDQNSDVRDATASTQKQVWNSSVDDSSPTCADLVENSVVVDSPQTFSTRVQNFAIVCPLLTPATQALNSDVQDALQPDSNRVQYSDFDDTMLSASNQVQNLDVGDPSLSYADVVWNSHTVDKSVTCPKRTQNSITVEQPHKFPSRVHNSVVASKWQTLPTRTVNPSNVDATLNQSQNFGIADTFQTFRIGARNPYMVPVSPISSNRTPNYVVHSSQALHGRFQTSGFVNAAHGRLSRLHNHYPGFADTKAALPMQIHNTYVKNAPQIHSKREQNYGFENTPPSLLAQDHNPDIRNTSPYTADGVWNSYVVDTSLNCPNTSPNSVLVDQPQTFSNLDENSSFTNAHPSAPIPNSKVLRFQNYSVTKAKTTQSKRDHNNTFVEVPQAHINRVQNSGIADTLPTLRNEARNPYMVPAATRPNSSPTPRFVEAPLTFPTQVQNYGVEVVQPTLQSGVYDSCVLTDRSSITLPITKQQSLGSARCTPYSQQDGKFSPDKLPSSPDFQTIDLNKQSLTWDDFLSKAGEQDRSSAFPSMDKSLGFAAESIPSTQNVNTALEPRPKPSFHNTARSILKHTRSYQGPNDRVVFNNDIIRPKTASSCFPSEDISFPKTPTNAGNLSALSLGTTQGSKSGPLQTSAGPHHWLTFDKFRLHKKKPLRPETSPERSVRNP